MQHVGQTTKPTRRGLQTCRAGQPNAATTYSVPVVPDKRPIRSRKLPPEPHDPEDLSLYVQYYPPWDEQLNLQNAALSLRTAAGRALPAAYQVPCSSPEQLQECLEPGEREVLVQLRTAGGYLQQPHTHMQLIQAAQMPTVRQLLKVGPNYEDDFFRGPDYRYAVDDMGRILDMVYIKRERIPEAFQHAITSLQPPTPPTSLHWHDSSAAQDPENQAAVLSSTGGQSLSTASSSLRGPRMRRAPVQVQPMQQGQELQPQRSGDVSLKQQGSGAVSLQQGGEVGVWEVEDDGRYEDFLGPQAVANAQQAAAGVQQAVLAPGAQTATALPAGQSAQPGAAERGPLEAASAARRRNSADDSYLDELDSGPLWSVLPPLPVSTSASGSQRATAATRGGLASLGRSQNSKQQRQRQQQQQQQQEEDSAQAGGPAAAAPAQAGRADSTPRGGHGQGLLPQAAAGQLVLRAYPYCIGRNQLFSGLWQLGLLEQLVLTDQLEGADLVLHRKPALRERQFAYDRLRARAKQLGIPFVTVRDGSAEELRASLTPVFQLHLGLLSPQQVLDEYGPQAKGRNGRRIRL